VSADNDTVPANILEAFVAAILNIQLMKMEEEKQSQAPVEVAPAEEQKCERFEDAPILSNDEIQRIHKEFAILYLNRKSNKPQKLNPPGTKDFQFKPSICKESVRLAESGRDKYVKSDSLQDESKERKEDSSILRKNPTGLANALVMQKLAQEEYQFYYIS